MITEHWALEFLPWDFQCVFWCDSGRSQCKFIQGNIGSQTLGFLDVMSDKFLNCAPPCDVLLGGFPCQPFSIQGSGAGTKDTKGRGVIVDGILNYVKKRRPRIVILENVLGLVYRHRSTLDNVVATLTTYGYAASWSILDMYVHGGVPCRRARVYIVGLLAPATGGSSCSPSMQWPEPIPCAPLSTIFDDDVKLINYSTYPIQKVNGNMRKNLEHSLEKVIAVGKMQSKDPTEYCVVADLGGNRLNMGWGLAPCLTKTRGQAHAFWSMQHGRPLTVREMCRLQGLNPDWLNVNVTSRQMGGWLFLAMGLPAQ